MFEIYFGKTLSQIDKFWQSTGYCPPLPHDEAEKWFLSTDMMHNLAYIGALPHSAIQQVRIHWLLNTIKLQNSKYSNDYNFTYLDRILETLWKNGLRPGFELMGNPGNRFTNFEDESQIYEWRHMIYQVIHRYLDMYGLSYVNDWNFESWNEPSIHHFDGLNFTIQGFLNYYDGLADAMLSASPSLRLGGPGGSCKDYDPATYCWALLNHTVHGRNYFDPDMKPILDYISIHRKGEEPNNTAAIFDKELDFYSQLLKYLPELRDTPIYNDEADPLVTWSADKWWRADVTYAAMIVKIIFEHQNKWIVNRKSNSLNFQLLSNDNGFLSYNPHFFTQRTLLARFQINNTATTHVQFIRKPAYTVMGLLAMLGETQVYVKTTGVDATIGSIATTHEADPADPRDSKQWSIIVYNSADSNNVTGFTNVALQTRDINCTDCRYVMYLLDNMNGNPHSVWVKAGSPHTPDTKLLAQMRENEEPVRVAGPADFSTSQSVFNLRLRLPGVALLHVCARPRLRPLIVIEVFIYNITDGQILIAWDDRIVETKCIKTYDIEYASPSSGFVRINTQDTMYNSFVYMPGVSDSQVTGHYRVRAVDYWGRASDYSPPVRYP